MISRPIRWVLWLLGMAAFAVAVALAGRHGSGYVVMVAPPFRVEMSVMMFVILAAAAFALGYVLIRLGVAAYGLPQHLKKRHAEQDRAKARDAVFASLELLFSGRFRDAEEKARAGMQHDDTRDLAAALSGLVSLDAVAHAIRDKFSGKVAEANVAAAAEAYAYVDHEMKELAHAQAD